MANHFYTVLVIPEKTDQVRRFILPAWLLKGAAITLVLALLTGIVMVLDYWYVMSQIGQNKQLRMENRRLKQQVQVFKNKMTTLESTVDRVKTFSTRLKVITNIEDHSKLLQSLNEKLPDAGANVSLTDDADPKTPAPPGVGKTAFAAPLAPVIAEPHPAPSLSTTAANESNSDFQGSPEEVELQHDYDELDQNFMEVNRKALYVEQDLQDLTELLADKSAFLAATPTIKPAAGYGTSGFGVRRSPLGGRVKMHEGLDIANRSGTLIKAPAFGMVVFAGPKAGYGQTVVIDHGYGIETLYGHTRKILVAKGQKVRRGETIALLGNTGRSTGPHLHYEVHVRGLPVDPRPYLLLEN